MWNNKVKEISALNLSQRLKRSTFVLLLGWTAAILLIAGWHYLEENVDTQELALIQARQSLDEDLVFRSWAAGHGGVYVPVTEATPSNPYLLHLENRDVTTTSGLRLTLMNPAYMVRQVHEMQREQYGRLRHLSSLNPLCPGNTPDAWEAEALQAFEQGVTEVVELAKIGDTEYLRLIRPVITEASCLKCHASQGYKVGDVRGGLSVSVPMLSLWTQMYGHMAVMSVGYVLIWLLGLCGIVIGSSRFERRSRECERVEKESARFSQVLEHSLNEIYLFDAETLKFIEVNQGARENLGYSLEELRDLTLLDLKPYLTTEFFAKQVEPLRTGTEEKILLSAFHQRKDGSQYPVEIHLQLITDDTPVFLAIILDITERKKVGEERARLMSAIEQSGETVVITDSEGTIQYVNPAFERITGYSREEAIGRNSRILKSGEHDDAFYREMWTKITSGKTWSGQIINKKRDGTLYTVDATISPVRNASGTTVNYVSVKHDITQQIETENQLRQSHKMKAVGQLAGGVAHDFNNMLSVIIGYTEMARNKVEPGNSIDRNLESIQKAAERSAELTRQLLAFSRKQALAPKVLNLSVLTNNMGEMLRRLIGEEIELKTVFADKLDNVEADPGQIEQIIMNLAINARDAMLEGGKLTIVATNVELDEQYAKTHLGASVGRYVLLAISDTGCGMSEATRSRIFEPFFSTKETGQGTGLGLAMVYGIVKQSGGYIWCDSEPGKGTTFNVYLPRIDACLIDEVERNLPLISKGDDEHILVVEDETVLRQMLEVMLKGLHYHVTSAENGKEALLLIEEQGLRPDLILTDVVMPRMGGKSLVDQVRKVLPDQKVLYMSGYTNDTFGLNGSLDPDTPFISKPFNPHDIAEKIEQVLSGK